MDVVRQGSATMRARMLGGGVLVARISGVLTTETLSVVWSQAIADYPHARGFVADYQGCALAVAAPDLAELLRSVPGDSLLRRPGAIVASPESMVTFYAHAVAAAKSGVRRRVFMSAGPAYDWARLRAAGG